MIALNLFFRTIDNENFRQLFTIIQFDIVFSKRTKMILMIELKYYNIVNQIKINLKNRKNFFCFECLIEFSKNNFLKVFVY